MAEKIFCRVCGAPKGYNWATCGTPACRRKHRAAYKAEHQRRRAEALIAAGRCVRCKFPTEGGDCPKCLAKKRAYAAKRARVKKRARDAEKKRVAAVIRLMSASRPCSWKTRFNSRAFHSAQGIVGVSAGAVILAYKKKFCKDCKNQGGVE